MAKFDNKKERATPKISTSSLPDIIFILLFFFMVATVMREVSLKVENELPQATETTDLDNRQLVKYIYIGKPASQYQSKYGTAPVIQLNDRIADVDDIGTFVEASKSELPEEIRSGMKIAIKMDEDANIGILTDVKQELRKANARRVNYTTRERAEVY